MALLVSLADYKTLASITGTSQDARLTIILGAASAAFRRITGRDETTGWESASRTETIDGNGEDSITLRESPVTAVTSVTLIADDGSETVLASTEYRVSASSGVLTRLSSAIGRHVAEGGPDYVGTFWGAVPNWPAGAQNIEVVYTGGYATIPLDIQMAVARVTDTMSREAGTSPAMSSESIGGYSYTRASNIMSTDESIVALCKRYRQGRP